MLRLHVCSVFGCWQLSALNLLQRVHEQFGVESSGTTVCATAAECCCCNEWSMMLVMQVKELRDKCDGGLTAQALVDFFSLWVCTR